MTIYNNSYYNFFYIFILGAIGSDFKIDASYLSPNVNMASRLEVINNYFLIISTNLFLFFI